MQEDSSVGTTIAGQFELTELIGSGGMSRVYKAKDLVLNREVACKLMHPSKADEHVVLRFQNEARNAARLSAANIASIYHFGVTDSGELYLIMEYLDNAKSLAQIITDYSRSNQYTRTGVPDTFCVFTSAFSGTRPKQTPSDS